MSRIKRLKKSMTQFPDIDAPSMWLLAFETRAVWEFWAGLASYKPLQMLAPKGDGHPVLVIPGLGASLRVNWRGWIPNWCAKSSRWARHLPDIHWPPLAPIFMSACRASAWKIWVSTNIWKCALNRPSQQLPSAASSTALYLIAERLAPHHARLRPAGARQRHPMSGNSAYATEFTG